MAEAENYEFLIDAYSLDTIPMARLARYLSDLAVLLGNKASVHLIGMKEGSVRPQIRIDAPDVPKVKSRIRAVRANDAPPDAMRAYRSIDDRLARDNARGSLVGPLHTDLIEFPGRDRLREIQPFSQPGTIDGIVMAVGGRDNPPTVHLQDEGKTHVCHASRGLIRRIAPHIYGSPVRVTGIGRWERNQNGDWILARFTIHDFLQLVDAPLEILIHDIRSEGTSHWGDSENPLGDLETSRHSE